MHISTNIISLFLGVVSGIITTVILFFLGHIYKKIVYPYFESFVYRGVNISGEWEHKDTSEISIPKATEPEGETDNNLEKISLDFELSMSIKQKAHHLKGSFRAKSSENGKEYTNYYRLDGILKDNYVIFSYNAERGDRTGVGSFILRVSKGGTKLIGSAVFTPDASDDDTKIVIRENMSFERK